MKKWFVAGACVLAIMNLPMWATAEGLGEASEFVCSSTWAISCAADKVCETGVPTEWNIPQFVVANLKAKTLSTPETSSERRTTPIDLVRIEDGLIFIQGTELGRAFSMVISASTGSVSGSITMENLTISVFGACTPLPIEEVTR
jgi:hypothetical protein